MNQPLDRLRHHVSGAIERGEAQAIEAIEAPAIGSISIEPTWRHNMAILILALECGTEEGKRAAKAELRELAAKLDAKQAEPAPFNAAELEAIGHAVQWAGHFATLDGCQPGGPAFGAIAPATAALEARGVRIPHGRDARDKIEAATLLPMPGAEPAEPPAAVDDEPAEPSLRVGAILYSSWGYDQTNVDFYRVEKIAGAFVTLQEIGQTEASDGELSLTGRVVPADPAAPIGDPFRRKILTDAGSGTVAKIKSYAFAYLWDGHPRRVSHYA